MPVTPAIRYACTSGCPPSTLFTNRRLWSAHEQSIHGITWSCPCGKFYYQHDSYWKHKKGLGLYHEYKCTRPGGHERMLESLRLAGVRDPEGVVERRGHVVPVGGRGCVPTEKALGYVRYRNAGRRRGEVEARGTGAVDSEGGEVVESDGPETSRAVPGSDVCSSIADPNTTMVTYDMVMISDDKDDAAVPKEDSPTSEGSEVSRVKVPETEPSEESSLFSTGRAPDLETVQLPIVGTNESSVASPVLSPVIEPTGEVAGYSTGQIPGLETVAKPLAGKGLLTEDQKQLILESARYSRLRSTALTGPSSLGDRARILAEFRKRMRERRIEV